MKTHFYLIYYSAVIFSLFLGIKPSFAQKNQDLVLIEIQQLDQDYEGRFDLSGIVQVAESIYVIADKPKDHYLYKIAWNNGDRWMIDGTIPLSTNTELDLEGVDYDSKGDFYLSDENLNAVFIVNEKDGKMKEVSINYKKSGIDVNKWEKNAGLEALAIDRKKNILYLAKERDPRFIIKIDLKSGNVLSHFNFPEIDGNDITDMKFEGDYLYILERSGRCVTKFDTKKMKVISKVNFEKVCTNKDVKLYEPTKYAMAEALLLTDKEVWIGIDNNGLEVSKFGMKKYNLSGTQPAILRFKRPKGF